MIIKKPRFSLGLKEIKREKIRREIKLKTANPF